MEFVFVHIIVFVFVRSHWLGACATDYWCVPPAAPSTSHLLIQGGESLISAFLHIWSERQMKIQIHKYTDTNTACHLLSLGADRLRASSYIYFNASRWIDLEERDVKLSPLLTCDLGSLLNTLLESKIFSWCSGFFWLRVRRSFARRGRHGIVWSPQSQLTHPVGSSNSLCPLAHCHHCHCCPCLSWFLIFSISILSSVCMISILFYESPFMYLTCPCPKTVLYICTTRVLTEVWFFKIYT